MIGPGKPTSAQIDDAVGNHFAKGSVICCDVSHGHQLMLDRISPKWTACHCQAQRREQPEAASADKPVLRIDEKDPVSSCGREAESDSGICGLCLPQAETGIDSGKRKKERVPEAVRRDGSDAQKKASAHYWLYILIY